MPEAADPLMSVGYLLAAVGVTLVGLGGYGLTLAQRLASARQRNRELKASIRDEQTPVGGRRTRADLGLPTADS